MFQLKQSAWYLLNKLCVLLIVWLWAENCSAQTNLVPNWSFETYTSCPSSVSQINLAFPWDTPTLGNPDYFNSCSSIMDPFNNPWGSQLPATGVGMSGLVVFAASPPLNNVREYIQIALSDTLVLNTKYFISFSLSLADKSKYSISNFGVFFSKTPPSSSSQQPLPQSPQIKNVNGNYITDKSLWVILNSYYISTGGEKYITIGNFDDDNIIDSLNTGTGTSNTTYYYIDDVIVMDSALVGVKENNGGKNIAVYPNPAENQISIKNLPSKSGKYAIIIYNFLGEKVLEHNLKTDEDVNQIDLSALKQGVYLYKIIVDNVSVKTERLVLVK